jgi:hypothetical protein
VPRSLIIAVLLFLPGIFFRTATAQTCEVTVPATIVDAQTGIFIPSITPAMLHAKIGKSFFPVSSVERIKTFRILLLLDASGSMTYDSSHDPKVDTVQRIKELLDENLWALPPGLEVGFGLFNKVAVFGNEFTLDPGRLHHLIPETTARLKRPGNGPTAILDAIHEALSQFGSVRPGDTILLITDGGENGSKKVLERNLAKELSRKGVRLFVVLVLDRFSWLEQRNINLADLAERSGGAVHTINSAFSTRADKESLALLKQDLDRLWKEQVLSAYLLHFNMPADERREHKWILAVDPAANGQKKVAAGYPSRLEPCPVNTAVH